MSILECFVFVFEQVMFIYVLVDVKQQRTKKIFVVTNMSLNFKNQIFLCQSFRFFLEHFGTGMQFVMDVFFL